MGPRVMLVILPLVAVCLLPPVDRTNPTDRPSWSRQLAFPSKSFGLAAPGQVLIHTKGDVEMLDSTTGRTVWSRSDVVHVRPIPDRPYGLATTRDGQRVIDLSTGRDRWAFAQLPFTTIGGVLPLAASGLLLVYGPTVDSPHTIVAVREEDGAVVWRQPDLFRRRPPAAARKIRYTDRQPFLVGPDLLLLDPTDDGLIALAPDDGHLLWRVDERTLKEPASYRKGAAAIVIGAGRLFVPLERTVTALNLVDGSRLWTTKKNFPSRVAQMAVTSSGLLVRGDFEVRQHRLHWRPYLALLDPATGGTRWSTEDWPGSFDGRSPFVLHQDQIVVGLQHGLQAVELTTGQPSATVPLREFAGGEFPNRIEEIDTGRFLLTSSQNARLVDLNGRVFFDRYFKPPGESLAAKIAYLALVAGTATTGFMGAPDDPLFRPFTGSENHGSRLYMLTAVPEAPGRHGTSLVRIEKDSGEESGRIWFGERFPRFVLDPSTQLVVVVNRLTVAAFQFDTSSAGPPN